MPLVIGALVVKRALRNLARCVARPVKLFPNHHTLGIHGRDRKPFLPLNPPLSGICHISRKSTAKTAMKQMMLSSFLLLSLLSPLPHQLCPAYRLPEPASYLDLKRLHVHHQTFFPLVLISLIFHLFRLIPTVPLLVDLHNVNLGVTERPGDRSYHGNS